MTGYHWGGIIFLLVIGMIIGRKFGGSVPLLSSL